MAWKHTSCAYFFHNIIILLLWQSIMYVNDLDFMIEVFFSCTIDPTHTFPFRIPIKLKCLSTLLICVSIVVICAKIQSSTAKANHFNSLKIYTNKSAKFERIFSPSTSPIHSLSIICRSIKKKSSHKLCFDLVPQCFCLPVFNLSVPC